MPVLYLVGTPIGNLEDISVRALRTLQEVGLIAAEDTRKTGRLLQHFKIETALTSFHDHSDNRQVEKIIARLAEVDIALVSDAGMPGLSDPGYRLVQAAIAGGWLIVPIPGPTAAVSALVSSGLPTDRFYFLGFLPRQQKKRRDALQEVATIEATLVLYESPHRILSLLQDIAVVLGDRQLAIGRELTKMHEEIWRGTATAAHTYFNENRIRGEFTFIIAGAEPDTEQWSESAVQEALATLLKQGLGRKEASATIAAQSGWRKRTIYNLPAAD